MWVVRGFVAGARTMKWMWAGLIGCLPVAFDGWPSCPVVGNRDRRGFTGSEPETLHRSRKSERKSLEGFISGRSGS